MSMRVAVQMMSMVWKALLNCLKEMRSRPALPGIDSEFYQIEQIFKQLKLRRRPAETLPHWLERLTQKLSVAQVEALKPIIQLHYRYRFDLKVINTTERKISLGR